MIQIDFRWKDGAQLIPSDKYHMMYGFTADVAQLNIHKIELTDAGVYECRAINEFGQTTTTAQFTVQAKDGRLAPQKKAPTKPATVPKEPKKDLPKFLTKLEDAIATVGDEVILDVTSKNLLILLILN